MNLVLTPTIEVSVRGRPLSHKTARRCGAVLQHGREGRTPPRARCGLRVAARRSWTVLSGGVPCVAACANSLQRRRPCTRRASLRRRSRPWATRSGTMRAPWSTAPGVGPLLRSNPACSHAAACSHSLGAVQLCVLRVQCDRRTWRERLTRHGALRVAQMDGGDGYEHDARHGRPVPSFCSAAVLRFENSSAVCTDQRSAWPRARLDTS